jgi:hypothetical protein
MKSFRGKRGFVLYRPIVRNKKKAIDRILVDKMEFSNSVLCSPSPQNHMLKIVKSETGMAKRRMLLLVTSILLVVFVSVCFIIIP